jgi:hypothetical protein
MEEALKETLIGWAEEHNHPKYFQEDPIIFPTGFARRLQAGQASLADVEIAALLAAHLAWGRRAMIVRDCDRMFLRCLRIDCANNGICYGELECQRKRIVLDRNGVCIDYTPKTMIIKVERAEEGKK